MSQQVRYLLFRLWSALLGIIMIALSLFLQSLLFLIIGLITIPMFLPQLNPLISFAGLFILFNGISCYEYYRKRRVVTLRNSVHKLAGMVMPDSSHASMALYLVPRGVDLIFTGTEYTG